MANIKAYFDDATSTVTYRVSDPETGIAAIIDPVMGYEPNAARLSTSAIDAILKEAKAQNLSIEWVLDTHAHADHLSAADYVRRRTGAKLGIGANITKVQSVFRPMFNTTDAGAEGSAFDALFEDGEIFHVGKLEVQVLHTPGHTPACVSYLVDDAVFVGDTLFMPDYGTARADFPGGDAATLYRSIRRILDLPAETRIFVGHDYLPEGRNYFVWESSVREQRLNNIHVHDGVSEEEFVRMRQARDKTLAAPRLILPSLQVNIRAGALPPAEEDGRQYLKIPVNQMG